MDQLRLFEVMRCKVLISLLYRKMGSTKLLSELNWLKIELIFAFITVNFKIIVNQADKKDISQLFVDFSRKFRDKNFHIFCQVNFIVFKQS